MKSPDLISVDELVTITHTTALSGTIDEPSYMANDRVYLFSGTKDTVVNPGVMKKLTEYYSHFVTGGNIATMFSIPAEHSMVGVLHVNVYLFNFKECISQGYGGSIIIV